jgi:hypothetical protein
MSSHDLPASKIGCCRLVVAKARLHKGGADMLVDHRLEIARYRRIKAGLLTAAHRKEIRNGLYMLLCGANDRVRSLKDRAEREKTTPETAKQSP